MEWTLELVLVVLLLATLFHAIRLERALGVLRRDRASLENLVVSFNASTHQAESGIQRQYAAADGAGRQIESQLAKSVSLKDDLAFLTERGNRLADRLDVLVREARPLAREHEVKPNSGADAKIPASCSQAEWDMLQALRMAR
jgi:hypothetical protein